MSPPVDPVTRFDHCTSGHRYDWEWRPMKQKVCQVVYIQAGMEMPGSLLREDSASLVQHYGLCTMF